MKKVIRLVTLLLALGLVFVMFGCSVTQIPEETKDTSENQISPTGKIEDEKPVKITVELFDRGTVPADEGTLLDNKWTKYINERAAEFGVAVEFFPIPRNQETDKLNILMASDGAPDIIFTYSRDLFLDFATNGGLAELDGYVEEYGPNIKEYFGEEILKYGRVDKKLYAISGRRSTNCSWAPYIRMDWLEKLKLPVPETTDQWYETMKAFRDNAELLGTKNVIPIGLENLYTDIGHIMLAFTHTPSEELLATTPEFLWPGFIDGIKLVNKAYREGLINPEFVLDQNGKKFSEMYVNNQIGYFEADTTRPWALKIAGSLREKVPEAKIVGIKGIKNKDGDFIVRASSNLPIGSYVMIPKTAAHPEACMKFLDWMIYEGAENIWFGFEGEHKVADGKIVYPEGMAESEKESLEKYRGATGDFFMMFNAPPSRDMNKQREWLVVKYSGIDAQEYMETQKAVLESTQAPFVFDRILETRTKYSSALSNKYKTELNKMIMESDPGKVDAMYEAFVKDYLANGGQEMIDEAKDAYAKMKN